MKKSFVIALMGMACLSACAQNAVPAKKVVPQKSATAAENRSETEYAVSGTCAAEAKKVYLLNVMNPREMIDSTDVANGKFSMKGKAAQDDFLAVTDGNEPTTFIADGTPVELNLVNGTLKGSPLNEKFNGYMQKINTLEKAQQAIIEPYMQAQREGKSQEELQAMVPTIQAALTPLQEEQSAIVKQVVMDNADNMIPVLFLLHGYYDFELSELKELLSDSHAYASHPMLARVKQYVEQEEKKQAIVGQQFIDIEENDTEGRPHKLSEYVGRGNYVLIDFWASWCGPCMQEMPNVKANYEKYKAKGFNVVGLSFDRAKEPWLKAIKEKELNWIHLSDLKFWQTIAASTYGINAIPSSLLVDPQGKVVARDLRGEALGKKLAEIYGE